MDRRIERLRAKGIPEHAIPKTRGSNKQSPANLLTSQVIEHMQELGGFAFRVNSQGNYSEKLGRFILSGSTKGVSDVIVVYKGLFIAVEVKIKDSQSDKQKRFQEQVESAGGRYLIARTFDQFKTDFQTITKNL